jgi:hypothetical protein
LVKEEERRVGWGPRSNSIVENDSNKSVVVVVDFVGWDFCCHHEADGNAAPRPKCY